MAPLRVSSAPGVIATAVFGGHTYHLLSSDSWTNSESAAQALGGHLATISSEAENQFVFDTFTENRTVNRGLWIGFTDQATEGTWVWISGEPVVFTKWGAGEPNNNATGEDHAHIFYPGDGRSPGWNDAPDVPAPFGPLHHGVVEVAALPDADNDGVPDEDDAFPHSDTRPHVVIEDCDSGVQNHVVANGSTFNDLIGQCATGAANHGQWVSCVTQLANGWKASGLISGQEKGKITSCAARADIP